MPGDFELAGPVVRLGGTTCAMLHGRGLVIAPGARTDWPNTNVVMLTMSPAQPQANGVLLSATSST